MANRSLVKIFTTVCFVASLAACSNKLAEKFGQGVVMSPSDPSTNEKGLPQAVQPSFAQFQDIPIPEGAKMNMDRTLVLGENERWIGRLVIDSQASKANLFDFFKYRTSQFGWQEITSVRAETSVLSYSKENRIMTIQIQSHILHAIVGTQVNITMSPKGNRAASKPITNTSAENVQMRDNRTIINPVSLRPVEVR